MCKATQLQVACEFGWRKSIAKRVLDRQNFKDAGCFIEFLEDNEDCLVAEDTLLRKEAMETRPKLSVVIPPPAEGNVTHDAPVIKGGDNDKACSSEGAIGNTSTMPAPPKRTLREETERLYKCSVCLLCFAARRQYVILPCSHFVLCGECLPKSTSCPLRDCKMPIESSVLTYMS